jgi:hypothetical protein
MDVLKQTLEDTSESLANRETNIIELSKNIQAYQADITEKESNNKDHVTNVQ